MHTIYPAAALFNVRETFFNSYLVEKLEERGYATRFPHRDGFEFGNLADLLIPLLPADKVGKGVQDIIYHLDLGVFMPSCDIVLANFDEPIDEGIIVEATYARFMNKYIIGFRTDVRTPYGPHGFSGMHFFPAYQCDAFITQNLPCKTPGSRDRSLDSFIDRIEQAITSTPSRPSTMEHPALQSLLMRTKILFNDIDTRSPEDLQKIARRYTKDLPLFAGPEII